MYLNINVSYLQKTKTVYGYVTIILFDLMSEENNVDIRARSH